MANYKFLTFNSRTITKVDGENIFHNRINLITDTINSINPDVIGFQELLPQMRLALMTGMPEYTFVGGGRDSARLDESPCIAYKSKSFMLERLDTEILSYTPNIPGSRYTIDQSPCPRAFCSADLMPISGGQPFRFMNVHTDHEGKQARLLSVAQMLIYLSNEQHYRPMPTVITGDFNAFPNSPEIKQVLDYSLMKFTDVTNNIKGTYHDYERLQIEEKIDYIFLSNEWKYNNVKTYRPKNGNIYISDHDPISVDVTI